MAIVLAWGFERCERNCVSDIFFFFFFFLFLFVESKKMLGVLPLYNIITRDRDLRIIRAITLSCSAIINSIFAEIYSLMDCSENLQQKH